ncbi:ATP synthase subunit b [Fundidesulfovibrio magnetotacticus]|uniref:ATP synthase subunit b n=1 Tax=Fundidesulfovibrio magnetotacticus TaxID=2730080 RepID=A0A6V8LU22_9BACT|nr:ATP synthase F0 subunit B [Fundidesulfovibrio magnetotacticus]GFK95224.1 ATP synthase subunit b [Fundidesulfovibrio magnetotacticus]
MKKARIVLFTLAVCLLTAVCAWASADGAEGPNWKNFILRSINFALVVGVVWWVAGKKIASTFGGRRLSIENQLADLEERKAAAQKRLADVEHSIANLEAERAQILGDYKAQGEALKASIVKAAEEQAERIKSQALLSAEQESKAAADALRVEMADKIIEAAQGLLAKKLTAEVQDKLVDDALGKVVLN